MASAAYDTIRAATLAKQQVVANYRGYPREMSPHVLGTKDGREHGLFYQFAGRSSSGLGQPGSTANWRCIFIDELMDVTIRDGEFYTATEIGPRPGSQTCVEQVDVVAPQA